MPLHRYRTTQDKIDHAIAQIEEDDGRVLSHHFVGGRDWVLIFRTGEPTVAEMTAGELQATIAAAIADQLASAGRAR